MTTIGQMFLKELEAEAPATRKCLERVPDGSASWKPHEKSMEMGYLALLVGEIPLWITTMVEKGEIDFANFTHEPFTTGAELATRFDAYMAHAREVLGKVTDAELDAAFTLRNKDMVLMSEPLGETVGSTINHMVHHRGQLTVYLRLKDVPVPQIYGPSADEKGF